MLLELVNDAEAFHALAEGWRDLLADSSSDCVFLTPEWLSTWWRHFADGRRLRVVVGRTGSRVDLIAPFTARGAQLTRGKPWGTLEPLGVGSVGSDYLDVILRRGTECEGIDRLAAWMATGGPLLTMSRIHADAARVRELADRLAGSGWRAHVDVNDVCPYITLASHSWESYLRALGSEHRANVRRRLRRLHERFDVSWDQARTDDARLEALHTLIRLHQKRWETRGGSTAFHLPSLVAFHEDFTRLALQRGWLRLFVLRLDGVPAAAFYGFRYGGTFSFYQSGFDPGYAPHGVGLVMQALAIRCAIEEGATEYDFLHGAEPYKFLWTFQTRALGYLELYPPTARGLVSHRLTDLSRAARTAVRRVAAAASA